MKGSEGMKLDNIKVQNDDTGRGMTGQTFMYFQYYKVLQLNVVSKSELLLRNPDDNLLKIETSWACNTKLQYIL